MPEVEFPTLPLCSYVTGQITQALGACFLICKMGLTVHTLYKTLRGLNELITVKHIKHYWEQSKCYVRVLIVLLWVYREKAGFFGKVNNARKNRRQHEMRKTRYEVD